MAPSRESQRRDCMPHSPFVCKKIYMYKKFIWYCYCSLQINILIIHVATNQLIGGTQLNSKRPAKKLQSHQEGEHPGTRLQGTSHRHRWRPPSSLRSWPPHLSPRPKLPWGFMIETQKLHRSREWKPNRSNQGRHCSKVLGAVTFPVDDPFLLIRPGHITCMAMIFFWWGSGLTWLMCVLSFKDQRLRLCQEVFDTIMDA